MRVFLSYASQDRTRAEEISLALEGRGHDVFFDRSDLEAGEDYHAVIHDRIRRADQFIFLISPRSVRPTAYTLTELRFARERWPHPKHNVLPVLIEPTPLEDVPAYLRGVTILEPEGNVAAEVVAHVSARRGRRASVKWTLAAAGVLIAVTTFALLSQRGGRAAATAWPASPEDFVTRYVYPPDAVERTEYLLDPTGPFRAASGDMIGVQRIAFGTLLDTAGAVSVAVAITNTMPDPIHLDVTPRFFRLEDDQGRRAQLVYFCCTAGEDAMLGAGRERQVQLLFRAHPGWAGKETRATRLHFHVNGLLPLASGTWTVPTLATARE